MTYGYIRVSTEKQTVKNQRYEIDRYCKAHKIRKIEYVEETASGMKDPSKRKLLALSKRMKKGDMLIIPEVSRLGRRVIMVINLYYDIVSRGIIIYAIKEQHEFKNSLEDLFMMFIYAYVAETERARISERTCVALAERKKEGIIIGRKKGFVPSHWKLTPKAKYINKQIEKGRSLNSIAHELGVELATLNVYVKKHLKKDIKKVS